MAFNPFSSFRKYQKFWMASILLLCMVTFVLCSGMDDLNRWVDRLWGRREGNFLAKLDGTTYYQREMNQLRQQRNLANDFMKRACELSVKSIQQRVKTELKEEKDRKALLPILEEVTLRLEERLRRPRYFGTSAKLDDLVDFQIWLKEADRLGIHLTDQIVQEMIFHEMFSFGVTREGSHVAITGFGPREATLLYYDLRRDHYYASDTMVLRGIGNEFRVRIAQIALLTMNFRPQTAMGLKFDAGHDVREFLTPAMLWDIFRVQRAEASVGLLPISVENASILKEIKPPTPDELKALFEGKDAEGRAYRSRKFDPTSDTPGFEIPKKVRAEIITGDPNSRRNRNVAKAIHLLEYEAPLGDPIFGGVPLLARQVAARELERRTLDREYQAILEGGPQATTPRKPFEMTPLSSGEIWSPLVLWLAEHGSVTRPDGSTGRHGEAGAAMVALGAQPWNMASAPLSYLAVAEAVAVRDQKLAAAGAGSYRHAREIEAARVAIGKARAPIYSTVVLAGAAGSAYTPLAMWDYLDPPGHRFVSFRPPEQYLPLEVVQGHLRAKAERRRAERWVQANLLKMKEELDKKAGSKTQIQRVIDAYLSDLGLEHRATEGFHNRHDIHESKALQPLYESYLRFWERINLIEGRPPETALKEGDFARLFFEGAEKFSAAGASYKPRPWPPDVTPKNPVQIRRKAAERGGTDEETRFLIDVSHALEKQDPLREPQPISLLSLDKPFLFWTTEIVDSRIPESLDEVKEVKKAVEKAWYAQQARQKALPKAKEIADELQKAADVTQALYSEKLKVGSEVISLTNLAPVHRDKTGRYGAYTLPKDLIPHPRDEMAAQLVALASLKEPVKIGGASPTAVLKQLDEYNERLFKVGEKNGKVVQILANQPLTVFYVACVTFKPEPSLESFRLAYSQASPMFPGMPSDQLLDRFQEDAGKSFQQTLMEQLRRQHRYQAASEDDRKSFDTSEGN